MPRRMLGATISPARALQYGLSVAGAVVAVAFVAAMLRGRWLATWNADVADRVRPTRGGTVAIAVGAVAGAIVGVLEARPQLATPERYFLQPHVHVWGYVAFSACCYGFAGVAVGALVAGGADRGGGRKGTGRRGGRGEDWGLRRSRTAVPADPTLSLPVLPVSP
ncbi:MAG: hypothetical protein WCJ30_11585 [Deltaproteobacteria bacterium]